MFSADKLPSKKTYTTVIRVRKSTPSPMPLSSLLYIHSFITYVLESHCMLNTALGAPKGNWASENWSELPKVTQLISRSGLKTTSESLFLYVCASQRDLFSPWFYESNLFSPQSTSDFSFSVIVENVNCYSSGIICRKFISINVGNSLIIFDDDSGNPVRPSRGEGCVDNLQVNRG